MVWFKVDDGFAFHPKALAAGNAALGLWVRAGSWCGHNLTDGELPRRMLTPLGGRARDVRALIDAGLWEECAAGYQFTDWKQWQPTKEQVRTEREATRVRVAEWREKQRNGVTSPVTNGVSTDAPTRPDPTRPEPVLPTEVPELCITGPKTSPKPRRKPEISMPVDWAPKPIHHEHAKPGVDVQVELVKFRTWVTANDRRYRDWDAGFTNWLLNAKPNTQPQRGARFISGAPGQMRMEQ